MGAVYGKKKAYNIDHQALPKQPHSKASAYASLQQHGSEGVHGKSSPVAVFVPRPDYLEGDEDTDLIKPKKLVNPVKASKSHQELHRELLSSYKRAGVSVEMKPELQRVLESRRRDQLIKQRKEEDEARRKVSPLEAELLKRHKKLEELERQQEHEDLRAPEFVKVKENLRRTSVQGKEEKEV
ncbi:actin-associated protein FAM107A isoform X1 [Maylandia zebra]|uniref:Actin-associated protein FAM107A n=1 Tax=Maylandia zebra TaxID=106582 RepID=A0A3P9DCV1_9CICH|nr:protein FAM107B isoform X1 [Maylandia zebra]XP_023008189.1 protein FAM107B isoform X1 [Maylandia zebra]